MNAWKSATISMWSGFLGKSFYNGLPTFGSPVNTLRLLGRRGRVNPLSLLVFCDSVNGFSPWTRKARMTRLPIPGLCVLLACHCRAKSVTTLRRVNRLAFYWGGSLGREPKKSNCRQLCVHVGKWGEGKAAGRFMLTNSK